MIHKQ